MRPSRREFMKWVTASGIALTLSRMGSAEEPGFTARVTLPGKDSWSPATAGKGRIDGIAKVTGSKIYASDFRAADLPGWPADTHTPCLSERTTPRTFMPASTSIG